MQRTLLAAAAVAVLLVTAGCLGPQTTAQSPDDPAPVRTIDVSGQGSVSAPPDLAKVHVAVQVRAETADAAREQVAADVAAMRDALREFGVPDDAVRTTTFSVDPEYDHSRDRRELIGYRATHAFEIETGVDEAGEVIDVAVANGATQVQGVQFTLAEETRRELRAEAIQEAMANARADAESIATASGVSVGPLRSASTADVGIPRPVAVRAEAAGGDGGARTVVEPGPVEVTATVSVAYEIR